MKTFLSGKTVAGKADIKGYDFSGKAKYGFCYGKTYKEAKDKVSRDEQEQFVSFLLEETDKCKFGVLLMLLSGVRIGELCALKWENVDLKERTMRVSATLQRLRNTEAENEKRTRIVVSTPKSETSMRSDIFSASFNRVQNSAKETET